MELALPKLGWKVWLGIGVAIVLVILVLAFPTISRWQARNATEDEITRLQTELAALSVAGGDRDRADAIRLQLRQLTQQANAYGSSTDLGSITLAGCDAYGTRIVSEWNNYRTTTYDDAVKRNNTRNTILNTIDNMARCYDQSIADSDTVVGLETIEDSLLNQIRLSEERAVCLEFGGTGCGRFGLNEPWGGDRAAEERAGQAKLRAALTNLRSKKAGIGNDGLGALT